VADRNYDVGIMVGAIDKASGVLNRIGINSVALGNIISQAIMGAGRKMLEFGQQTLDAAAKQERAEAMLAQAMKVRNIYSEQAVDDAMAYASSLQKVTTFGDEDIATTQRQLIAFGAKGQALKDLTKATLDLSAATGMDLKSAGDLIGKSIGSTTNALMRYGINIEGAVSSTSRMESAVKNITALYSGAASAAANVYDGQMKQLSNRIGDIQEGIGFYLIPAIKKLVTIINTSILPAFEKATEGTKDMKEGTNFLVKAITAISTTIQGVVFAFSNWGTVMATVAAIAYKAFSGDFKGAMEVGKIGVEELTTAITEQASLIEQTNEKIVESEKAKMEAMEETTLPVIATIGEAWNSFYDSINEKGWDWQAKFTAMYNQTLGGMKTSFSKFFVDVSKGFVNFKGLVTGIANAMKMAMINMLATIAAEWLAKEVLLTAFQTAEAKKRIEASSAEAGAKAAAASAWMLFGALAIGAAIMGLVAAFADKFATGGIVGGNSKSGDNVMARVNSGEMILNASQQARLFAMANGGGGGGTNVYITGNYILDDSMAGTLADKVSDVIMGRVKNEINI